MIKYHVHYFQVRCYCSVTDVKLTLNVASQTLHMICHVHDLDFKIFRISQISVSDLWGCKDTFTKYRPLSTCNRNLHTQNNFVSGRSTEGGPSTTWTL